MQNVYVMYIKISYKFHRISDTQSRVITKVYDFLGQPSYCIPRFQIIQILNVLNFLQIKQRLPFWELIMATECTVGNLVLRRRASGAVKRDFRIYMYMYLPK